MDKSFYAFCLFVADIFVQLDSADDEVEIFEVDTFEFEAVETFELDGDTCSRTFAGARWLLRRRIAAFFSAIERNDFSHIIETTCLNDPLIGFVSMIYIEI